MRIAIFASSTDKHIRQVQFNSRMYERSFIYWNIFLTSFIKVLLKHWSHCSEHLKSRKKCHLQHYISTASFSKGSIWHYCHTTKIREQFEQRTVLENSWMNSIHLLCFVMQVVLCHSMFQWLEPPRLYPFCCFSFDIFFFLGK